MKTLCRKRPRRPNRTGCFQKKIVVATTKAWARRRLAQALSWPHAFDGLLAPAPPAIWCKPPGQFQFGAICRKVTFPQALALVFEENYLCEPAWPSATYWSTKNWYGYMPFMPPSCLTHWQLKEWKIWSSTSDDLTARTTVSGRSAEQPVQHLASASSAEQPAGLYYAQMRLHTRRMGCPPCCRREAGDHRQGRHM